MEDLLSGALLEENLKDVKIGIAGVLSSPSFASYSHSAGWNMILCDYLHQMSGKQLKLIKDRDDLHDIDCICLLHGPNYREGVYNLMGGMGIDLINRLQMIEEFEGPVFSIGSFSFKDFYSKRMKNGEKWKSSDPIVIDPTPYKSTSLTIGDSHSISVWNPGSKIIRMDGKTLYGWLKNPLDFKNDNLTSLTSYFGNIDLRFHLAQQKNPIAATEELACRYLEWLTSLDIDISVAELLPIEDESRVLPGTGKLNGKNFYGSLELRQELRDVFNSILDDFSSVINVLKWPDNYVGEDGKLKFEVMEARKSVHLRPDFYKWSYKEKFLSIMDFSLSKNKESLPF